MSELTRERQKDSKISSKKQEWDIIIKPQNSFFKLNLKEVWGYRDLVLLFVRRDFIAIYKQTILGPLWHLIQPLLTTITFTVVFGRIAGIGSNGVPHLLFYMSGIVLWSYFGESLNKTSNSFITNAGILSKVYFPRLVIPISIVISSLIALGVQLLFFACFILYYHISGNYSVQLDLTALLLPVLIILMALLGLGFGIVVAALTTKYRDLTYLVRFGVQLLMYASSVIFPLSTVQGDLKWVLLANPMTPIIETFRYAMLGPHAGVFNWWYLLYSTVFALVIFLVGILMFRRVEKTFTDTL